ncbi:MAG: alanine dehydrogenase [Bacteroidetes bacterium]|nr:MAG: alanine dehydrogenase [Bacteroidota bacterium]
MSRVKLGVIREGKVPPDFRVPLTPEQCRLVEDKFPMVQVIVQSSPIRSFKDEEYRELGIEVQDDLSECDVICGVKEVNVEDLIPGKKFLFFSHTIKKQPYNRKLLQAILDQKIQLIDYEVLKDKKGKRLIGFGRYAGIVGCYNGFRAFGRKHGLFELKAANACADRDEVHEELKKVKLPKNTKIVLTGFGRVGNGAREIIDRLPIKEVSAEEFLKEEFDEPVYTHLDTGDYYARKDGKGYEKSDFYSNPQEYKSVFNDYAACSDMYVACHYWSSKSPFILTAEDLQKDDRLKVVADVSCDIAEPIACTIRPSTIQDPFYGYDPVSGQETDYKNEKAVMVMAVDNLPCELPKDASEDFGNELIRHILPALFLEDPDRIIERGSETDLEGRLTPGFEYLQDFVNSEG